MDLANFDPSDHTDPKKAGHVDPGTYICLVETAKKNSARGKPQIDMTVKPIINVDKRSILSSDVFSFYETATLTENAIWRFAAMCEAIGTGTFNANSDRAIQEKVVGRPFKCTVVKNEYGGKERRKIGQYKELTATDQKLIERWEEESALGGNSAGDRGWEPVNGGGHDNGEWSDDEIPF